MEATAIVGAQYGSEGKGHLCAVLARTGRYDAVVRTGGPNAGHTYFHDRRKFVSRGLPVAWVNPEAMVYIGPGAVLHLPLLEAEVEEVEAHGYKIRDRLVIDRRATVVTHAQEHREGGKDGQANTRIGSTGEGVGMARMARINRGAMFDGPEWDHVAAGDAAVRYGFTVGDVPALLEEHAHVLLEGTQGSGLSLVQGPWPFCTSADTNAAQLAADAGVPPAAVRMTYLVARTFPIRVAGNSGPLANETSWDALGIPPEVTTVTKKTRRVGRWDSQQVKDAIRLNKPCAVVVTFMDYLFPEIAGLNGKAADVERGLQFEPQGVRDGWAEMLKWVDKVEGEIGVGIEAIGTGPASMVWLAHT